MMWLLNEDGFRSNRWFGSTTGLVASAGINRASNVIATGSSRPATSKPSVVPASGSVARRSGIARRSQ
eukprot:scaffold598296_cov14-Prasinocladus_malaysianus.AAC.1